MKDKKSLVFCRVWTLMMFSLSCSFCLSAQTNKIDQVIISYVAVNKSMEQVLNDLSERSNVSISYNPKRIPRNTEVSINAIDQPLGIILKAILEPRKYSYEIIGNQITIFRTRKKIDYHTISGYVTDKETGEKLVSSNIYLLDKSIGTQTNEYGFYSILLPKGNKEFYYSYLGYNQETSKFYLQKDTLINMQLTADARLNEIVILDDINNQEEPQAVSETKLHLNRILTAATLGGESDVMRLLGLMPGVDSGADGLGGMNVRGGSADQNLVLLDGVPIYNPNHALGLFSVFNSDIIKNASLIKGNIPSRYGGRLSSVLDVRMREGNNKSLTGSVSLSAIAAKGSIEGPIGKNGSSFLVSYRRTYLDPWLRAITSTQNELAGNTGSTGYSFYDFNGKLSIKLGTKHFLYITSYSGGDDFTTFKEETEIDNFSRSLSNTHTDWSWGNQMVSAKLVSQYSQNTFGRLTTYYTRYDFDSFEIDDFQRQDLDFNPLSRTYKAGVYASSIEDIGVNYDFDYIPHPTNTIRTGGGIISHKFSPSLVTVDNSDQIFDLSEDINVDQLRSLIEDTSLDGQEYFGYIEDEISLGYGTTINVGLRANYTVTGENDFLSIQPRVSFLAKWEKTFFKVGVSRMNQYLHLLSSNGLGLPTDIWIPSTDHLAPEQSWMGSIGFGYYTSNGFRAGIEGYYKIFDRLTTFDEGGVSNIGEGLNWEREIPVGTGEAYGTEVYFDKIIGRTTWNFNYAFAFSFREFEGLNEGPFPFRYNRRHNIKLGFLHKITSNTEFVSNAQAASGNPITSPTGEVITNPVTGELLVVYDEKNNGTLPLYYRIDLGVNLYNKYEWGRTKLSLGVYNVFNRQNPFYIDVEREKGTANRFQIVQFSILPIVPTLGFSVAF